MKKEATEIMKEETETLVIPKESKHDDALFIAVNGRRMLVRKGEPVTLPKPFAEVVNASFAAKRQAERYIDSVSAEG